MEKTEPTRVREAKTEEDKAPEESDLEKKVTKFCELTSLTRQEAAFHLECHNYELQDALSSYFEEEDNIISTIDINNVRQLSLGADTFKEQERKMLDRGQKKFDSASFSDQLREYLPTIPSTLPASLISESVVHPVACWKDDTVDEVLRRLGDSWESPKKKQCLGELSPANEGPVAPADLVKQKDNRQEAKEPPRPIEGVGNTSAEQTANSTPPSPVPLPEIGVIVDETSPSVSIEIWLSDGTKLYPRFNYHHTIGDMHAYIDAERPFRTRQYQLEMLRVPPPIMTDLNETIELAAMENLVFIQKYLPDSTHM